MQKLKIGVLCGLVAILAILSVQQAEAGAAQRFVGTNTLGSCTISNSIEYYAFQLSKLKIAGLQPAVQTGAITRVTREGFTNVVIASCVTASGIYEATDTNSTVLMMGDRFEFSGFATNTGGKVLLEGEQLP